MPLPGVLVGALPRQDVRSDAVQEPAVVRGDDRAAGERQQRLLERLERLGVEVVGRLVEQQEVSALLERERQVQTVTLAAGEHAGTLLLVGALEAERRHVRAARDLLLAHDDVVVAVGDDLPHVLLGLEALAVLVDVGELHGLAQLERAARRLFLAHDHLEQRRLAHAVRADHAHDAVARQAERQIVDQHALAEGLVQVLDLEDLVAQARAHGNVDVGVVDALRTQRLGLHLLVRGETSLALGLARLLGAAHPLELGLHLLDALGVLLGLGLHARGLRLQVGGVVALVGVERAAVDLADPLGNVVQKVAVVRDGEHRTLVVLEELLEPEDRLGVQVVGRLVQKQQVRCLEQDPAERHAAPLATGEVVDQLVGVGALQRVHRLRELAVQVPPVHGIDLVLELAHLLHQRVVVRLGVGHLLADIVESVDLGDHVAKRHLDVLLDGLGVVKLGLLLEQPHRVARRQARLAVRDLLLAGHDLEQRRLAHAVRAHDADLGPGEEPHRHVVKNDLVAVRLANLVHLVDEFRHVTSFVVGSRRAVRPRARAIASSSKYPTPHQAQATSPAEKSAHSKPRAQPHAQLETTPRPPLARRLLRLRKGRRLLARLRKCHRRLLRFRKGRTQTRPRIDLHLVYLRSFKMYLTKVGDFSVI